MVLGLSVTRVLLGVLTVFRIRRAATPDGTCLGWNAFYNATRLLVGRQRTACEKVTSTFLEFLLLVLLTLSLVVSAALLLSSCSEDEQNGLRVYFEQNGHYALLSLSTYFILGFTVNITFFQASPKALWGVLDIIMIVLPVCALKAKSRK